MKKKLNKKNLLKILMYLLLSGLIFSVTMIVFWVFALHIYPLDANVTINEKSNYSLAEPLPVSITESGSAAYNDKFYIVGGIGWYAQTFNHFYEYNPDNNQWVKLPDLPEPINHASVVAFDNKIFVVGGFEPIGIRLRGFMFANWKPLNKLYIYDLVQKTWSRGTDLPQARGAGGCTVADSCIWYVGGINSEKEVSNSLFKFEIKSGIWTTMNSMKIARDHLRMESVGNKLYAISGRKDDLRFNLTTVECYDIETNMWTPKADFPVGRGGFSSVVFQDKIYTFGGENVWSCYDNVEKYDPINNKWEKLKSLPEARHGIQAGVLKGKIHLISGGPNPRISVSRIHRVFTPEKE